MSSILGYFKLRNGLPDPKGPLSGQIPRQSIIVANREVERAINEEETRKKRGKYNRYSSADRADIGRYACQHGTAAAARYFSRKLKMTVSENTVVSIKKQYRQEKRKAEDDIDCLPHKRRGRSLLLGSQLDEQVQVYLRNIRKNGGVVSSRIVMAAAKGFVMAHDRSQLAENGGHIVINRHWAYSLLSRMKFVQRKASTAKSKLTSTDFARLKQSFLQDLKDVVAMEEIPIELVLNWDQTGLHIVPSSCWTMNVQGAKRVDVTGTNDKRQITAVLCGTAVGDFLPPQIIYKGTTPRCHPRFQFPPDWNITHSKKHWSNEQTMLQYISEIIIPYVKCQRELIKDNKPALVIMDNFKGQIGTAVMELLENHTIHVCLLPPNTTDVLQPLDVSVNKPVKKFLQDKFQEWYADEIMSQLGDAAGLEEEAELDPINLSLPRLKELGAKWLVQMAEYIAENPQFIVNGFVRTGILGALSDTELDCEDDYDSELDVYDLDSESESEDE